MAITSRTYACEDLKFESLGLDEELISILSSFGILKPTNVQRQCIPHVLSGQNVIACAQTGKGKTAAFVLPVVQCLARDPFGVFALVITPTRELAFQISNHFNAFTTNMKQHVETLTGGFDMQLQAQRLLKRPHVIVATLGRLVYMLNEVKLRDIFKVIVFLVIDEADTLLEPSFMTHISKLMKHIPITKSGYHTLLFSVTMTRPIEELKNTILSDAYLFQTCEANTSFMNSSLREQYILVPVGSKEAYLSCIIETLQKNKHKSCIIFVASIKLCNELCMLLKYLNENIVGLHSHMPQLERLQSIKKYKNKRATILVVTDVASRGLDIPKVDVVINFDIPKSVQSYLHRVGRTARTWRDGLALNLVTRYDIRLIHKIEAFTGRQLELYHIEEDLLYKHVSRICRAKKKLFYEKINPCFDKFRAL